MSQQPGIGSPGAVPPGPPAAPPPAPPTQPAPNGGWQPGPDGAQVAWGTPPSNNNGCLKACLIVGAVLVGLVIVGGIALVILGGRLVEQVQRDPDSFFGAPCTIASPVDIGDVVGENVQAFELDGLLGGTMDAILDKRLLPDAPDCYVVGEDGFVARIAVDASGGQAAFAAAREEADGRFLSVDIPAFGDEAFCTEVSQGGSGGVLVRWDETVAYVSVAANRGRNAESTCDVARRVAATLEP